MRPKHSGQPKASAERVVKDIRRATRRHFSAEDKIREETYAFLVSCGIPELK
jgi:ribosomal protein L31E